MELERHSGTFADIGVCVMFTYVVWCSMALSTVRQEKGLVSELGSVDVILFGLWILHDPFVAVSRAVHTSSFWVAFVFQAVYPLTLYILPHPTLSS